MVAVLKEQNHFVEQKNNLSRSLRLLGVEHLPLTEGDLDNLKNSGISSDVATACHIFRVDGWGARQLVASKKAGDLSGIVFPYFSQNGDIRYSIRRDNPEFIRKGSGEVKPETKYLRAAEKNHIYIPPMVDISDLWINSKDLIIVEGEKKAISLQAECDRNGLNAVVVGLPGVWNWRATTGKTINEEGEFIDIKGVIPDFGDIEFSNRNVTILFDTNVSTNQSVATAERALAEELSRRGSHVKIARIPELPGINGIDDLIGNHPGQVENILKNLTDFVPEGRRQNWISIVKESSSSDVRPTWGNANEPHGEINSKTITNHQPTIKTLLRLLAEAGFSDNSTRLVFAIISLLDGEESQEIPYRKIFPLVSECQGKLPDQLNPSQRRKVSRRVSQLNKDQKKTGIFLFKIEPGKKQDGVFFETKIDPKGFFSLMGQVEKLAERKPGFLRNKTKARSEVMGQALASFREPVKDQPTDTDKDDKRKNTSIMEVEFEARRIAGMIKGFATRLTEKKYSIGTIMKVLSKCIGEHLDSNTEALNTLTENLISLVIDRAAAEEESVSDTYKTCNSDRCQTGDELPDIQPDLDIAELISADIGEFESFADKNTTLGNDRKYTNSCRDIAIERDKVDTWSDPVNKVSKEFIEPEKCLTRSTQPALTEPESSQECTEIEELKTAREKLKQYANQPGFKEKLKSIGGLPFYFKGSNTLTSLDTDTDFNSNLKKLGYPEGRNTRQLFNDLLEVVGVLGAARPQSIPVSV